MIYGSLDTLTGGYLYDRRLVEHLRQQGDEVIVFSLPWRRYGAHLLDNFSSHLVREVAAAQLDLLLEDELNHPSLVWLNRPLGGVVRPIVSIVHHLRSSEPWPALPRLLFEAVEAAYLRSVDAIVCTSRTTARSVGKALGRDIPTVVASPGGNRLPSAVTADLVRARAASGPLEVVHVGTLTPRKGLDVLLRGLASLPRGAARLTVVGDEQRAPAFAAQVHRLARTLDLEEDLRWLGPLPDIALADVLSHSHVLAVPSLYEGFGIVYLEAMAFGLACLASTAGGAAESVEDGATGVLIRPGDSGAITRALLAWSADRPGLARMGVEALKRSRSSPTWEQSTSRVRQFLTGLTAGRSFA
jgi:glycosyltransferase involved in cell wall biosynthesis